MTPETPLAEVAHHLPMEAAGHLLNYPSDVQQIVLHQIRITLVFWEERGYNLDPIAMEAALIALVSPLASLTQDILEKIGTNAALTSQLTSARRELELLRGHP